MSETKEYTKLYDRSRSKRSTNSPERPSRPYLFKRSKPRPRQAPQRPNDPTLSLDGDESSSDESGLDGESDSEGEDLSSDEEEDDENTNPFASSRVTGPEPKASITATTTMANNPFATAPAVSAPPSAQIQTSAAAATRTSQNLLQVSATEAAASSIPTASSSNGEPQHTTAIALGSVLGVLSVAIGAYLLFRYCTPLKNRVARFRGRRGIKLPGEEDGLPPPPPQQGRGMVQSGDFAAINTSRYSKAASSIATPAPTYTRDVAIAVPITSTRVPAPISIHPSSRDNDLDNPFSDHARNLSRNNSNKSTRSQQRSTRNSGLSNYEISRPTTNMLGEQGTYAFNFSFDDYRMSGTDLRRSALTNNPPFAANGPGAFSRSNSVKRPVVPYPSTSGSGLGIDVTALSQTPQPTLFDIPYAPPSEAATPRTQYMPRQRQSITPSESVSNAPYSPLPFPAGLMPAMPAMNSRWSKNSSSVWARTVDERNTNLPATPAKAATRPPPLPLKVRTSTSSLSSTSSSESKRRSSRSSDTSPDRDSVETQSTLQPASAQRLKTVSTIIGLPSSVRPASNTGSGLTLKPLAYQPSPL